MPDSKRGINLTGLQGNYGDNPQSELDWHRDLGPEAGVHYPLHDERLLNYYHSKNVGIIRPLFSWERMQHHLWGPVPDPIPGYAHYFSNFKEIVDYATTLGMTVIIEPWQADAADQAGGATWLGRLIGDSPTYVDRYAFADFWQKLAAVFKDNPLVEYGLVNEPHGMSTSCGYSTHHDFQDTWTVWAYDLGWGAGDAPARARLRRPWAKVAVVLGEA